ncbi:uncharacterized protein [Venturia canescens]|uniref:uncharacterized protein n=1 Tax=Venturia canescens TaxID=32260 RepID=UPI001C9D16AA|nr:uncharacterized protein LOC122416802 [Venturia canescens]
MNFVVCSPLLVFLIVNDLPGTEARGSLVEPRDRVTVFRASFPTLASSSSDENNCGGRQTQYKVNGGKCGVCGDDYAQPRPRANENGGKYGKGEIVETYEAGTKLVASVELLDNKFGFFEFALCPLGNGTVTETEECFEQHKLHRVIGGYKYHVGRPHEGPFLVSLRLPRGLTCEHCVLRWQYTAGLQYGCGDGFLSTDCGDQEIIRSCSDVKIR